MLHDLKFQIPTVLGLKQENFFSEKFSALGSSANVYGKNFDSPATINVILFVKNDLTSFSDA